MVDEESSPRTSEWKKTGGLRILRFPENRIVNYEVKLHFDSRNHAEQKDIIKTTLYEPEVFHRISEFLRQKLLIPNA